MTHFLGSLIHSTLPPCCNNTYNPVLKWVDNWLILP